jgi:hypothetical protein
LKRFQAAVVAFLLWGLAPFALAIEVMGDRIDFLKAVHAAIRLLKEKSPDDYAVVERYVPRVKEVRSWHIGGMAMHLHPPTFLMARSTALYSVTWAASALAHDACHSRQWHKYSEAHKTKYVPGNAWSGQAAELECLAYQAEVLRRLKAPEHEIQHVLSADGRHSERRLRYPPSAWE